MLRIFRIRIGKYLLIITNLLLVQGVCIGVLNAQNQVGSLPANELQADDKGRVFIKDGGWSIPNSAVVINDSFGLKIRDQDRRKVKLKARIYEFSTEIVSDEPLQTLGFSKSKIRYTKLFEYRINGKIFCYKLLFSYVSMGVDDFLAYYDEDGDGVFESLVMGETVNGGYLSSNIPHIPQWLLTGKSKKI